jgi:hypothetical protein
MTNLDGHERLQEAVEHITTLASREVHAELFIHHRDGSVERCRVADVRLDAGRSLSSMLSAMTSDDPRTAPPPHGLSGAQQEEFVAHEMT